MLVTATVVFLVGFMRQYAPGLYSNTQIDFVESPQLGNYWHVTSGPSLVFAGLLMGLVATCVARFLHGKANRKFSSNTEWICSSCHEKNPGNFAVCWKCQCINRSDN